MKKLSISSVFRVGLAAAAILASGGLAKANPFASCITNTSGTISFYLNEGGASVTVTYEDGSTNANFNGITTSTNVPLGVTNFSLGSHTSYSITVTKTGSGSPNVVASSAAISNTRGIDANKIPTSPYFGHIYDAQASAGVWLLNPDLSKAKSTAQTAGVFPQSTASTTFASPDWVAVNPDGTVMVTDESLAASSVYQVAPDFSSAKLFLGPIGATNEPIHGTIISRAILTGSTNTGNAVLYTVDGDLGPGNVQVYNIGSGPLPWTNAPNYQGPEITVGVSAEGVGGNEYVGFTQGPNGYFYGSTYRAGTGSANFVTILDATGTNVLWSSEGEFGYPLVGTPPTGDWFYQPNGSVTPGSGIAGTSAVSPDGKYLLAVSVDNYFIIAPLTNGIPDTSKIFTVTPTSYTGNGRGVCWDAADNILLSSSGIGLVQEWSLGGSSTCVTTGTASGTTGFTYSAPSTTVSVVAITNLASQGGYNGTVGTPISGAFSIYRTGPTGSPLTVNYALSGTATGSTTNSSSNIVYTVSSTSSVVIPAGQTNVLVNITPTTNNVPRLTNTVIISLLGAGSYSTAVPFTDTIYIENTSSQKLVLGTNAPSMYKAFSNDTASFTITRLGDTTVPSYTISNFTFAGTAALGVDYTRPTNITFNPGDVTYTNVISPLVAGQPPVDTTNPVYSGNLTAIIGLGSGTGYATSGATNVITLTSIDNAVPPATVIWSTPLTDPNEASNWVITYDAANIGLYGTNGQYEVNFGYDLTANNPNYSGNGLGFGIIGYPPSGASNCLRITVNKYSSTTPSPGGVNAFPITGTNFGGNYAVRFYMNLVQGSTEGSATEGALFGINHAKLGYSTNWFTGTTSGGTSTDGIWYWIDGQAGGDAIGDFTQVTTSNTFPNFGWQSTAAAFGPAFANNFKYPAVYNSAPGYGSTGVPANESSLAAANVLSTPASTWADVEIKQINNVVTLSIDKIPIFVTTNNTIWTNGIPMLGYDDPYSSVQNEDGAAFFSDLRVVAIGAPAITGISDVAGLIKINFVTTDGEDTPSSFTLLGNGTNTSAHVDTVVSGVTFTQLGEGAFQASLTAPTNSMQFYRIKHN